MRFRLAEGARSQTISGRTTIFIETSQQLFEIDDITAHVTDVLVRGASVEEVEGSLAGCGMGRMAARAYVAAYLVFWSRQGLLNIEFNEHDRPPFHSAIDIAGTRIGVGWSDENLCKLLTPLFPPAVPNTGSSDLEYAVTGFGKYACISRSPRHALVVRRPEAAPALKAFLTEDLLARLGMRTALHGALLGNSSGSVLLCGSPGAGKTTLACALTQCRFQCYADDIVLLDIDGTVTGVPFASALKAGSWTLLPHIRDLIQAQPVHRRLDGKRVRYLPSIAKKAGSSTLKTIVLLKRTSRGRAQATPLDPLQVLAKLVSEASNPERRLSAAQFDSMLGMATNARAVELTYSRLSDATETLTRFHDAS